MVTDEPRPAQYFRRKATPSPATAPPSCARSGRMPFPGFDGPCRRQSPPSTSPTVSRQPRTGGGRNTGWGAFPVRAKAFWRPRPAVSCTPHRLWHSRLRIGDWTVAGCRPARMGSARTHPASGFRRRPGHGCAWPLSPPDGLHGYAHPAIRRGAARLKFRSAATMPAARPIAHRRGSNNRRGIRVPSG